MTDEQKEALKTAGLDDAFIASLAPKDDGTDARLKALEASLEAATGKANGILSDKKKAQAKAEELQAKIEELEGKDLGEVDKLRLDMERLQSKYELEQSQRTELEATYGAEKRSHALNKIGSGLKWMDGVPDSLRSLTIEKEFDGIDLGNEVLVADKMKTINETYAGLLASDAPSGAGSRAGDVSAPRQGLTQEQVAKPNLSDVASDPLAYVMAASEVNQ
jgi:predicted RNase H-like nuclease (RuvC/YqgF family)